MAMRAPITKATVVPRDFRALLFSTERTSLPFNLPLPPPTPPPAEPSRNLVITGLNKRTSDERLHHAFAKFGKVVEAKVECDKVSGYCNGYGFVKYETSKGAAEGIEAMHGQMMDGWLIFVRHA